MVKKPQISNFEGLTELLQAAGYVKIWPLSFMPLVLFISIIYVKDKNLGAMVQLSLQSAEIRGQLKEQSKVYTQTFRANLFILLKKLQS